MHCYNQLVEFLSHGADGATPGDVPVGVIDGAFRLHGLSWFIKDRVSKNVIMVIRKGGWLGRPFQPE